MKTLAEKTMRQALTKLDQFLNREVILIMGGGGAMILAHHYPLVTHDIDAIPRGIEIDELDKLVKKVAKELDIASDWLNPYYATFAHTLPEDYGKRLVNVYRGKHLSVEALEKDDLLIMKCFAHRQKDVPHAIALIKKGADLSLVERQLEELRKRRIPGVQEAMDFLDDIQDQME